MFDAEKKAYWNQRETLLEKYEDRWVAIVNGEVAAVGEKNTEVMLEAFRKTGCKVMYVNKVGHEKTALRKRIRQYTTGSYDEEFDPPMPILSAIVMDMIGLLQKQVHFIIDTGADITVLEEHICTQLGIRAFPVFVLISIWICFDFYLELKSKLRFVKSRLILRKLKLLG